MACDAGQSTLGGNISPSHTDQVGDGQWMAGWPWLVQEEAPRPDECPWALWRTQDTS